LACFFSSTFGQLTGSWQGVLIQNNLDGTTSNFSIWIELKNEGNMFSGNFRSEQILPPYYKLSNIFGEIRGDNIFLEEERIIKHETQNGFRWCLIKAMLQYNKPQEKLIGKYISKNEWCESGKLVLVKSNKKFNDSSTEVVKKSSLKKVQELLSIKGSITGLQFILKEVHFLSGKYKLASSSFGYLNHIAELLNKNSNIKIHLKGHTDSDGDDENNFILSQKRAKSVANYFIKKGVNSFRITYEGYGKSRPIIENDSPENKQINRRVELLILSQ
jgi:outer membrane protein OmpA-like peptidoglycan-associated protein